MRTHALGALVLASLLRGLALREVAASLDERFGGPTISKSTVSRICEQTRERWRPWCERRLAVHDVVSCLLDAISLQLRAGRGAGRGARTANQPDHPSATQEAIAA